MSVKNEKIVTANLMGGLGNYLFQIAAAYAYGLKHGHKAVFNPQTSQQIHRNIDVYLSNILRNITVDHNTYKSISHNENGFHYTEIPSYEQYENHVQGGKGVYLHGYYQTAKYFEGFDDEIRELFSCDDVTKATLHSKYPFLHTKEYTTCSIHIRRGDYLNLQETHPVQGMNYFMKAIKKMPKDCHFLIFSDDIAWCKGNFPDMPEKFLFIEGQSDIEDLYAMSMCDNNIICNSTFSWWAAFLNGNKDKVVVAPKTWFGPKLAHHDTSDIYDESWIKI